MILVTRCQCNFHTKRVVIVSYIFSYIYRYIYIDKYKYMHIYTYIYKITYFCVDSLHITLPQNAPYIYKKKLPQPRVIVNPPRNNVWHCS